jgi:hypothetical protein
MGILVQCCVNGISARLSMTIADLPKKKDMASNGSELAFDRKASQGYLAFDDGARGEEIVFAQSSRIQI